MSRIVLPRIDRPRAASAMPRAGSSAPAGVRNSAGAVVEDDTATIRLYEEIDAWGWWGTSAQSFADTVDGLPRDVRTIHLRVNSPGGDVFDGIAIANTLRAHKAKVVVTVDGLAASIASVIALAGDELRMGPNSEFMIHDAWGVGRGNAEDLRQLAGLLDHLSDNIAGAYAAKAGGTAEEWRDRMRAETWYSAAETVEASLADGIAETVASTAGARAAASFDTTAFRYASRGQAPGPSRATEQQRPAASLARAQAALIRARTRKESR